MRLVVADTGPLNYLVLIRQIEVLPALFERVFIPELVRNELQHSGAPTSVRRWIAARPSWLEIVPAEQETMDLDLSRLVTGSALRFYWRSGSERIFCLSTIVTA
jgi:predicted nucleic acid-binding protein